MPNLVAIVALPHRSFGLGESTADSGTVQELFFSERMAALGPLGPLGDLETDALPAEEFHLQSALLAVKIPAAKGSFSTQHRGLKSLRSSGSV